MVELDEMLKIATKNISHSYFQLPISGMKKPIYRERVYCYELYHQLRSGPWGEQAHCLNGEVDKAGHPLFPRRFQPDFLIHVPGSPKNFAVIEVKACNARSTAITKDLRTLDLFLSRGYQRAIYLVYGFEAIRTAMKVKQLNADRVDVEIWLHASPGQSAQRFIN